MNLYPHNQLAYDKLSETFENLDRAAIVQPTGTGKSYITAQLIENNPTKTFLCLTSIGYIADQFNSIFSSYYNNYTYLTYPSLLSNSFLEILKTSYDYIILDEFHRIGAEQWGEKVKQLISNNTDAKILGLTATHIRYQQEDRNLIEEFFDGNLIHYLTLMECFDKGILPRPKYVTAIYNIDDEYNSLIDKINNSKSSNKSQIKKRIVEYKANWEYAHGASVVLQKHITNERNFLIFCRNINHLEEMIFIVKNWFKSFNSNVNTFKVYAENSYSEQEFEDFKTSISLNNEDFNLLFSVQQLNEGLHVPNIDGIIFLRPTDSHIIYYQQLGRGLATKSDRTLVFDMVNNFNKSSRNEDFSKRTYTPVLKKEYLKTDYDKFKFSFEIIDEVKNIEEIFNDFTHTLDIWNYRFNQFKVDITEAGSYDDLSKKNKIWLNNQRTKYRNSNSEWWEKRAEKLDSLNSLLGFDWKSNSEILKWYKFFEKFKKALIEAKNYENLKEEDKRWLYAQRASYKKSNSKSWEERVEKLDSLNSLLGFDWRSNSDISKWHIEFKYFKKALVEAKNYENLKQEDKRWLVDQRARYKISSVDSSYWEERVEKLDSLNSLLGFDWKKGITDEWELRFEQFKKALVEAKNYQNLKQEHKRWLHNQKTGVNNYSNNSELWKERDKKFESLNSLLGFDWNKTKTVLDWNTVWNENFEDFKKALIEAKNYKNLKQKEKNWLISQRASYKKSNSKSWEERAKKLDSLLPLLGFDWNKSQTALIWDKNFEDFKKALVEAKNYENLKQKEKNWLITQRVSYGHL